MPLFRIPVRSGSLLCVLAVLAAGFLTSCASQERRTARVENRQDRIDRRTDARQDRWAIRAEREDARAARRFDSW